MKAKITWKTVKSLVRQAFAPIGEPEPPDHKARWVLKNGAPDWCCEQHRLYTQTATRSEGLDA
jgi:hypothetical protein